MNSTPPIHLGNKPRWRRATRLKALVATGAIALGFAGVGLAASGPALADPSVNYVLTGSDTIQDVMNGFALTEGNILGSYNAVNPVDGTAHQIITPSKVPVGAVSPVTTCSFIRPNGSTEGSAALDFSLTGNTTNLNSLAPALVPGPPQANCVDIARSSSAPKSATSSACTPTPTVLCQSATGGLVFIPFALDAVAGAVGGTTNITQANLFTSADLTTLYSGCNVVTEGGVTYWPSGSTVTQPAGSTVIDLYIPQNGSGTEKFWAGKVGMTLNSDGSFSSTQFPCVKQTIVGTTTAVEEHNGLAVSTDPNGYMPFSIAQWIAQSNGIDDRRHGAVLTAINGVAPTNAGPTLNTAFPFTREVYLVTAFDRVVSGVDTNFDATLSGLLTGTSSVLCRAAFTIRQYGFSTLGTPTTTDNCGSTASTLRAVE